MGHVTTPENVLNLKQKYYTHGLLTAVILKVFEEAAEKCHRMLHQKAVNGAECALAAKYEQ